MARLALGLALCIMLSAGALGARLPSRDDLQDVLGHLRMSLDHHGGKEDEERRAFLALRFRVPPTVQDKFIDEWQRLEDKVDQDKDNIMISLGKVFTDNQYFYAYEEWETGRAAMDHFTSKDFRDFKDFADDNDVEWEFLPLRNVTSTKDERRKLEDGKRRKGEAAHVLIRYDVPPSAIEDFIDEWEDVADKTWDEKPNYVYSLRRVVTTNNEFWVYGEWEDLQSYHEHFHSKHVRRFRENIDNMGVNWHLTPLEKFRM